MREFLRRINSLSTPRTAEREIIDLSTKFIRVPVFPADIEAKELRLTAEERGSYGLLKPEDRDEFFAELDAHAQDSATQSTRSDIKLD